MAELASKIGRALGRSMLLSALVAVLATAGTTVGLTYLSTQVFGDYGWGLLVAAPTVMGFTASLLYAWYRPRSLGQCIAVAMLGSALVPMAALFFLGADGLVCLLMAGVLWVPLALVGSVAGWILQRHLWQRRPEPPGFPVIFRLAALALIPLIPLCFGFERLAGNEPAVRQVTTTIDIAAPPHVVWRYIVSQPDLPAPTEWIFRAGVACPLRTRIVGQGVGAERYCDLSTGSMPERITAWEEPRRLAFQVLHTPSPMQEVSLYRDLRPPHSSGYFQVLAGQFELQPLPGGGTRVIGTSWYRNRVSPGIYSNLWCDYIVHAVHQRVFEHLRRLSTAPGDQQ